MIGITAMQIALVDLLKEMHVKVDYYLGYSIGEIACAYADEALTKKQAILCSYYIGLARKNHGRDKELVKSLRKVITSPKLRSSKWVVSTENTQLAETCSAEYLIHTLSSSTSLDKSIPRKAIVVEIAPHGHFQDLLRNAFSEDIIMCSLLDKDNKDNIQHFLSVVGDLYLHGCNPRVEMIYPDIKFPVSRGTRMISPLIRWNYEKKWPVYNHEIEIKYINDYSKTFTIQYRDEDKYLYDHVLGGNVKYVDYYRIKCNYKA